MSRDYIRLCPVCGTDNAAEALYCRCGSSLIGIDFSLRPPAPPIPAPVTPTSDAPDAPPPAEPAQPLQAAVAASTVTCGHADCGQPNPAGVLRCLYCNRPLPQAGPATPDAGSLSRLLPPRLAQRLAVLGTLPTVGAEADLLRVQRLGTADSGVLKLYRPGLHPDPELLQRLQQARCPHVVRLIETGVADGQHYELMEHCPHGTLRQWLQRGPLPVDDIRAMVAELAQALAEIHAQHILHRDLKPENVLVRQLQPLALALTDFGVASLRLATQHFTGGARTVLYAAPEALTGVIDEKSDWWALGMVVYEAATGRHPFEQLSEQVVNLHLATRPIDTRALVHDALRQLCQGLLLRDPCRRWGAAEVQRWLAGDPTLPPVQEDGVAASAVRHPYRIGQAECRTAVELAVALAQHWDEACKDLSRGTLARWLEHELHDLNLLRQLQDILEERTGSADRRLLAFLLAAAPDIPAVWRGQPLSRETLLIAARQSVQGQTDATHWLASLYEHQVLALLAGHGRPEVAEFDQRWREALRQFDACWQTAREAEHRWQATPKPWHGSRGVVVDMDRVMFAQARLQPLPLQRLHGNLLLALYLPPYAALMRQQLAPLYAQAEEHGVWLTCLGPLEALDGAALVAATQLAPLALEDLQTHLQASAQAARYREGAALRLREEWQRAASDLGYLCRQLLEDWDWQDRLVPALDRARQLALRLGTQPPDEAEPPDWRNGLGRWQRQCRELLQAQTALDEIERINAIALRPRQLGVGLSVLLALSAYSPLTGGLLTAAVAAGLGQRLHLRHTQRQRVAQGARSLLQLMDGLGVPGCATSA